MIANISVQVTACCQSFENSELIKDLFQALHNRLLLLIYSPPLLYRK